MRSVLPDINTANCPRCANDPFLMIGNLEVMTDQSSEVGLY